MSELRDQLFHRYHDVHGQFLDSSDESVFQEEVDRLSDATYLPHLPKQGKILEVGCGKGHVLKWFVNQGYSDVGGVDLSPADVEHAKSYVGIDTIVTADALDFLVDKTGFYDVIISKATLEHIEKNNIHALLQRMENALAPSGKLLIHVPNMDWIMAQHERYMDMTHEVGFTKESLAQVLRLYFNDVRIVPGRYRDRTRFISRIRMHVLKPITVRAIRSMLNILGEGAGDGWFEYRSILGVGTKRAHATSR